MIHEWWGLNDAIRAEAKKLAGEGYAVLAVDLYRGRVAADADEAHELMRGLPEDRAIADLKAAYAFLSAHPAVLAERIGSIGWCMGGGYSLALAAEEPQLTACFIYYGRIITDTARLSKIQAGVYGFFGEDDRGIPVESVRRFEKQMADMGKYIAVNLYKNAGHAFANPTRASYNDTAAKDAWARTLKHLKEDLHSAILRVRKTDHRGDTVFGPPAYQPGERVVVTIAFDNDGKDSANAVEIIDFFDTRMIRIDLDPRSTYGNVFLDSGMPTWGGRFDLELQYCSWEDCKKLEGRPPKKLEELYRPLTREVAAEDVGGIRWKFHLIGPDAGSRLATVNHFLAPDNENDDRRTLDAVAPQFGAKADDDAGYVRYAFYYITNKETK